MKIEDMSFEQMGIAILKDLDSIESRVDMLKSMGIKEVDGWSGRRD